MIKERHALQRLVSCVFAFVPALPAPGATDGLLEDFDALFGEAMPSPKYCLGCVVDEILQGTGRACPSVG